MPGDLLLLPVRGRITGACEKETKGGKGRAIALPPMLVAELRRHRTEQAQQLLKLGVRLTDDHHVFSREDGSQLGRGR
jgi:hypothetical protein